MLQIVGKLEDQDAVFADQPHQGNKPDLGVNVDAGALYAEQAAFF
jgi:hypothetical protein